MEQPADALLIRRILDELDKYNLPVLPAPAYLAANVKNQLELAGLQPPVLSSLSDITNRVIHVIAAQKGNEIKQYRMLYFDRQGQINQHYASLHELLAHKVPEHLTLEMFEPGKIPAYLQARYQKSTSGGKSPNHTRNFAISAYRALIKLPVQIGETNVDPNLLYTTIYSTFSRQRTEHSHQTGFLASISKTPEQYGISMLDYIRAAYSKRLLPYLSEQYTYTGPDSIHPACVKLFDPVQIKLQDNWKPEQKMRPLANTDTNPEAYKVLTRIERPMLERNPENPNKKTFDRVRIFLSIKSRDSMPNRNAFIQQYQKDIAAIAASAIAKSKSFRCHGIPIQFLRLTNMTLTTQNQLELIFELKNI